MANSYRSSEGLSARPLPTSDGIQLRIDPLQGDLDDQITGLHTQVRRLKSVAQEIEVETKVQNDIISDLQMALSQAGDGVKNGMRRLRKVTQQSSNHIVHVIIFGLIFFSFIYMLSKLARR